MSSGLSGLLAFQRALDTTSHNIANASTEGYVRQRVELGTQPASPYSNGWIGNGVNVTTVRRTLDDFLVSQTRTGGSTLERLTVFADQAERVSKLLVDGPSGLSGALQKLQNAIQGVATQPTSIAARQVLLGEARGVSERLQYVDGQLRNLDAESAAQVGIQAGEINSLASGIARLNKEINSGIGATGQPPNDLLDQRDRLIDQLSGKIGVTVVPQDGGILNVFVGRGQTLVLNETASTLGTTQDAYDGGSARVTLTDTQGTVDITASITGGRLGGLLDFRSQVLDPARSDLGRLAVGIGEALNVQHRSGVDLRGALGADLFSVGSAVSVPRTTNTGSAQIAVTRSSAADLTGSDYELEFTGAAWSMKRLDTGAMVSLAGTGTVADPLRADGLSMVVSGTPASGDRMLVRPTREAIAGFGLSVTDPARIAAAAPIIASANAANSGSGAITRGEVLDPTNPQLRSPVALQFLTPTTYSVNGAGSFTFTSGQPIDFNGWRVSITGAPATGDRFAVADGSTSTGDNRNVLAMADALTAPRLDGGTTSIPAGLGRLTGEIGTTTQQAQVNRDAQQVLQDESVSRRQNYSGVNLDEEAANLLRYQQAYQAAAQLIRVANEMFQTLLDAAR
jgi:flagellar hook-associated protein 1